MSNEIIVVTAATGNIGKVVVKNLLAKGKKVRAAARGADKLKSLGAEVFPADVENAEQMKKAFAGAAAVFTLIPPKYDAPDFRAYQNKVGENYAAAIAAGGVKFVVNLSSLGAHLPDKTGPIKGLYDFEQRLNGLADVNVVHIRPAYFMENHLWNVGLVKGQGINGSPLRGDVAIPQIAAKDIADRAAELLSSLNFSGKSVQELLGQREVSLNDVTRLLGEAVGKKDLKYVQFSYEDSRKAMSGMGFSPDVADLFIEMNKAFNEGLVRPTEPRSAKNTTPTSIEDFAEVFAAVFNAQH